MDNNKNDKVDKNYQVLKRQKPWSEAFYYQKSEVLYQLTYAFCQRYYYQSLIQRWSDEEMANTALTLCYQTDSMLNKELLKLEKEFVEKGGIKERMHAARTGYRQEQDEELNNLRQEVPQLKAEITRLRALLEVNGIRY